MTIHDQLAPAAVNAEASPPGNPLALTKFVDPLPIPPFIRVGGAQPRRVTIRLREAFVRLHAELPLTRVWTYNGHFPGPTLEVRQGQRLRVAWKNELRGPLPLTGVEVDHDVQQPGRGGATARTDLTAVPPWIVTHVHGIAVNGGSDGWPENAILPGAAQLAEYPNDQPAGTFWYHDHAMGLTRWNVLAGLAGMYLIRDHEEAALHLPSGDREVPLIIGDRNLDVDAAGNLSGDLLYKVSTFQTEPEHLTVPFSGPFTLVNGKIWPFLAVRRRWYRFRIVNTCNARTYQLQLVANDGTQLVGVMQQIGSDGGLFGSPITVDRLTVAPGERADVLINFAPFAGQQLRLVNLLNPPPEPGGVTPNPDVMQFRVAPGAAAPDPFSLPTTVSPSFVRLDHDSAPHGHRWIALTPPGPGHPELWEMEEVDPGSVPVPSDGVVQLRTSDGQLHTLRRVARGFRDRVNFVIPADSWQQWAFIHLGGPAGHPMHIHLARVQALVREQYAVTTFDSAVGGTVAPIEYDAPGVLDPNEQGWKDVVRVGPGQLVRVLGRFSGGNGAFVYHCHIFEHEDEAMMRPFVVMPESVMPFDPHSPGGHDHDH